MKLNGPTRENPLHVIHRWSIEHPYAIIAFFVAIVIGSWYSIAEIIPRRFAPYVESPMVGVVTMMPGLSARDIELEVSKPIEESLNNVKGLRFIRSSSQEGFSIVTLEFPYGADMQRATLEIQRLMNVAQSQLPASGANLKPSIVVPIDPLNLPILSLSLTGEPEKGWTPARLRELADNQVVDRLKRVEDVYSVVPFGGFKRQLQVLVDRTKLAGHGLSILDVRDAIDRTNVGAPAGTITDGTRESAVRVDDRARTANDVADYPVTSRTTQSNGDPSPKAVFVKDIGRVVDGYWERRSGYENLSHDPGTNGSVTPGIEVSVVQNPGASSAKVVPKVLDAVHAMEREYPGTHFAVAYDNSHFVGVLFDNVWHELAIAVLLTAIAIFLFLGEWRATLIALITVPTSLGLAILLMALFGITFNSGSLIGLLLAIGRLVDDSIIDIHSIERHLRLGKTPKQATIDGIADVRVAVIASTLMIAIALTPLLFAGGLVGQMFVELVWPLLFGLIASMLVSFTLTAVLCANLLRPAADLESDATGPSLVDRLTTPFQSGLLRLEAGYGRLISWLLHNRFANMARVIAMVVIGFTFYQFLGSEMMPLADTGQAVGFLEMEPGTSFSGTQTATHELQRIMLRYPELEKASIEIGSETLNESWNPTYTGYQMPQVNGASMILTFSDKDARRRSIWQVIDSIDREALATIPGIRRLQIKEMGSDVMADAEAPIQLNIYGPDLAVLDRLGREVFNVANRMKGEVYQPASTWTLGLPEYRVKVDLTKASQVGLSPDSIANQAYYALRGGLTDEFFRSANRRQDTILVRYDEADRTSPLDLLGLPISTPTGKQIPLSAVADIERASAPTAIEHDGLRRVIGVNGFYRLGHPPSMDTVMDLISNAYNGNPKLGVKAVNFPPGYGVQVRGDMTQMMDSMRRLTSSLVLSLVLMYLVLVVQFKGFLQPLQMIASLPLELAGVFTALWLAHASFSTVSMLGIIVLTGMDITTAVLMIDLIMKNRDNGMARDDAIKHACPERLRPILMTSLITMIVMLPIAIAPKTGLDAYQPLAVAIVGGLLAGTILSLIDIPIMHSLVDDTSILVRRMFTKGK